MGTPRIFRAARYSPVLPVLLAALAPVDRASAGPNLMAIGNYADVPFRRAEGRDSYSGKEIIYAFDDPEYDFGRIIVRSNQPNSVVRRDLFVGFTGQGVGIDLGGQGTQGRGAAISEVEVWLRIQGAIRPDRSYEWEMELTAGNERIEGGVPAIIPAFWADGKPIGGEVIARTPEPKDTDRIQRLLFPHGVVNIKSFERQTGGAWVVLEPTNFGDRFAVIRFSFREIETAAEVGAQKDMPIPVRYVPIRDVVKDDIAEALQRGGDALKAAENQEHYWAGNDLESSVVATGTVVAALGEIDPKSDELSPTLDWLAAQVPDANQPWGIQAHERRLYCLARYGDLDKYRSVIQTDIQFLLDAQIAEDGGWAAQTGDSRSGRSRESALARSDNAQSAQVLLSLREGAFAGAIVDPRVWRSVLKYWTDAQAYDGGYREQMERFGGVGRPTTSSYTALGAASTLAALDMASGVGGRQCTTFLASRNQLRAVDRALEWLNKNYRELFNEIGSSESREDPSLEPAACQYLGEVTGLAFLNGKDHLVESARSLLVHYDRQTGQFGVRRDATNWVEQPSLNRTALTLSILAAANAPAACQRIIAGADDEGWLQYKGDVSHVVRYLSVQRGRPLRWRRADIDDELRNLVKVPVLVLSVVGPFEWLDEQWRKIRQYCFAGGTVLVDIADGHEQQRASVVAGLRVAFPEYELEKLSADAPVFSAERTMKAPSGLRAIGNGFRHFLFLPEESWSCQWQLYQMDKYPESFAFMNNLLTYATDETPLRSSLQPSTYSAASASTHRMTASRLEIGADRPVYPDLIESIDRLLQENYRLRVEQATEPSQRDVLWVSVAGAGTPTDAENEQILDAIRTGSYLMVDLIGGDAGWDETFRKVLSGLDGVTLELLRRVDPIYTGEIAGTQGFDVVEVELRKALHTPFRKRGRCDLYAIKWQGRRVGVYSAYDIASGIGYHYFPGCRGVMPEPARELAMNVFLAAYEHKLERSTTQ